MVGRACEGPVPPANLLGDFGGGLLLAFGIISAVLHAKVTGVGQVVDSSIVDGTASFLAMHLGFLQTGLMDDERGANSYDGGAHYYDAYETRDGRYMAAGSAEPDFYAAFLKGTGLDPEKYADQQNRERWPEWKKEVAAVFKTKTRAEWCAVFDGADACVTPVYSPLEAPEAPDNQERSTFVTVDGVVQPGSVPRFSATPGAVRRIGIPARTATRRWTSGASPRPRCRRQGSRGCSFDTGR
jgi:alpha-methylacyl-CoA racemase